LVFDAEPDPSTICESSGEHYRADPAALALDASPISFCRRSTLGRLRKLQAVAYAGAGRIVTKGDTPVTSIGVAGGKSSPLFVPCV